MTAERGFTGMVKCLLLHGANIEMLNRVSFLFCYSDNLYFSSSASYLHYHHRCGWCFDDVIFNVVEIIHCNRHSLSASATAAIDKLDQLMILQHGRNALYVAVDHGNTGTVGILLDYMHSVDTKVQLMADLLQVPSCKELFPYIKYFVAICDWKTMWIDFSIYFNTVILLTNVKIKHVLNSVKTFPDARPICADTWKQD